MDNHLPNQLNHSTQSYPGFLHTPTGFNDLNKDRQNIIETYDLRDQIEVNKFIPQSQLHKILLGVDQLLLLRWNDPREDGVIAGKLFEYIGVGKPTLSIGSSRYN